MRSDTHFFFWHIVKTYVRFKFKSMPFVDFSFSLWCRHWVHVFHITCSLSEIILWWSIAVSINLSYENISLIRIGIVSDIIVDNFINVEYKHLHLRIKPFSFKKKTVVCILKITRVQQGTAFSAVFFYSNDATDPHTSHFLRGKRSALFCRRIE